MGNFRLVHGVQVQAVYAVVCQVDQLLGGVLDACLAQRFRVVSVAVQNLHDSAGKRNAAHEHHALHLLLAHNGHDAAGDGRGNTCCLGFVPEAVEAFVVEEQLGYEEVGTGILLGLQVLQIFVKVHHGGVRFGVGGGAHAEAALLQKRDKVGSMAEARAGGLAFDKVAAQG